MNRIRRRLRLALFVLLAAAGGGAVGATVTSALPAYFTPGVTLTVSLTTTPDPATQVQALEETPPTNWVVSAISHGGGFDPVTGRVKWGPFLDATSRVLTYQVTAPDAAVVTNYFVGRAVFDAIAVPVTGERRTMKFPGTLTRTLPADYLPGVGLIVTLHATPASDVTVWAVEESVPAGWRTSGISAGGQFDAVNGKVKWGPFFDATERTLSYLLTPAAGARSNAVFLALARFGSATLTETATLPLRPSGLTRTVPATYVPGVPLTVTLTAVPAPYVQTLALEEQLPDGWIPTDITGGGQWDALNRKVKWGPYLDLSSFAGSFSYRLVPPPGTTLPLTLAATAVFDQRTVTSQATVMRFLTQAHSTIARSLPAVYRPGQPLTVTLAVVPADTALVYAIEENVPPGWVIGSISHGGAFDSVNRRVKWGPFLDVPPSSRMLTYLAIPPLGVSGTAEFTGVGRFDQTEVPITGATTLPSQPSTVRRTVPGPCLPGVPLTVTLSATPASGVSTYAVVEEAPVGWTLGALSDGGSYDAVNHQLKWGPFLDGTPRQLTYELTPPADLAGPKVFAGYGLFDRELVLTADNALPVLTLPASPLIVTATSVGGAVVTFVVTATDPEDGPLMPTVIPASGSVFPIGDMTVNITVMDSAGGITSGSLLVRVVSPPPVPAAISGRFVFYNQSAFDGNDPAANAGDDGAIAWDKTPLLPGGVATIANYTSFSRGLNGIMLDVANLANPAFLGLADFQFKIGNDNFPGAWSLTPAPASITVRPGAGTNGGNRVSLIWSNNVIQKTWLEITLLATTNTGLVAADVCYFGNAPGESGNSDADAKVTAADSLGVLNHITASAAVTNHYDFNRDGKVGAADRLIVLNNQSGLKPLRLIDLSGGGGGGMVAQAPAEPTPEPPIHLPVRLERRADGGLRLLIPAEAGPLRVLTASQPDARQWEELPMLSSPDAAGDMLEIVLPIDPNVPQRFFRLEPNRRP